MPMLMRTRRAVLPFTSWFGAAGPLFLVGLLGGLSCKTTIENLEHCYYKSGNDTCADRYDGELPYCATTCAGKGDNPGSPHDDGCVDWVPDEGCYSPCGGENDVADDAMCLGVADTGSTSMTDATTTTMTTTTIDPTSETGDTTPPACKSSDECTSPDAPICVDDECRPCGDAASPDAGCALRDPALPVCGDSGACVQCSEDSTAQCTGTTPVCDAAGTCIGCTRHDQCADACAIATGECFPDTCIRDVPNEHPTVQAALDGVDGAEFCVIRVRNDVTGSIVLDGATTRAIVYFGGGSVFSLVGSANTRTLRVLNDAVVYVDGVRFEGNDVGAIDVSLQGVLYLDRVEVVGNAGDGIRVLTGAYMQMRNSIVAGNGDGSADTPGVQVYNAAADILYSTIADNDGMDVDTLDCVGSDVTVRNSILMGAAAQSIGCDATITFSAVDENVAGTGNVDLGSLSLEWFTNAPDLNFHLSDMGVDAFADIARWIEGDPPGDIDDDDRVAVDGASEPAGADVPN